MDSNDSSIDFELAIEAAPCYGLDRETATQIVDFIKIWQKNMVSAEGKQTVWPQRLWRAIDEKYIMLCRL